MDFTGKTVLITGGTRGIGRAIAIAFAKRGAKLAINYRSNDEAASKTYQLLDGGDHIFLKANIADPNAVEKIFEHTIATFGKVDIVVNNAGIFEAHPIDESSYEEWQEAWKRTMNINLFSAANICYCAAQHMMENGGGRIVNISSRGAFRGEPQHPAYGASKAAMNAMSQSLAQALAPHQIFVGVVAPGFVETDMTTAILASELGEQIRGQSPLNRVAKPEDVAYATLFLASEGSEFSTGTIIDVNGASYLRS